MALLTCACLDDAEVLGFDVAVRDRLALEVADGGQEVGAPTFEVAETQAPLVVQPMSERSLGGVRKDQARVASDIDWLAMYGDDRAVTQLGEDLALLAYAVVAAASVAIFRTRCWASASRTSSATAVTRGLGA